MGLTTWTIADWTAYTGFPADPDAFGCTWWANVEDGWRIPPAPRLTRVSRPRRHGEVDPGQAWLPGRTMELSGVVEAPDHTALVDAGERFAGLLADGMLTTLVVDEDGAVRQADVRLADQPTFDLATPRLAAWKLPLLMPDPLRYGAGDPQVITTGLPSAVVGLTVPLVIGAPANQLAETASGFETGMTWINGGNATVTQQATNPRTGSNSMRIETVSAGDATALLDTGAAGTDFTAVAGQDYWLYWGVKTGLTSRTVQMNVDWYDSTPTLISTTTVAVTDTTSYQFSQSVVTAPAGTVGYELRVKTIGGVNTERHYVDDAFFGPVVGLEFDEGGTASGQMSVVNVGTAPTRPDFVIAGPVINPRVEIASAGKVLSFVTTLGAADTLTIRTATGEILLNGSTNARNALDPTSAPVTSVLFPPGLSQVFYRASSSSGGSVLTVTFRSAFF